MNGKLIAIGCVIILVALGFVFPQIAEMRTTGVLPPAGVLLLMLGVFGTSAGLWCVVQGARRRSTPAA